MARPLVIIGTGGNALDILDIVEAVNRQAPTWQVAGFLDDARPAGSRFQGAEVLGGVRDAARQAGCAFVNAIGSDKSYRKRPDIVAQTGVSPDRFATLVHPLASVSGRAAVGPGTCVNPGVVVAGGVTLGSHVWLGSGCVIGHDAEVADHALIAPGAVLSGFVRVGAAGYVGAGACVRQRVTVGAGALVGLGAVVIADVAAETTVVGNPSRALVRREARQEAVAAPAPANELAGLLERLRTVEAALAGLTGDAKRLVNGSKV